MYQDSAVKQAGKPRILVAPLDWGLGHATRCIPLIYEMLRQNADVWLAAEGAQESLLKQEFPSLPFLKLRGYRIKYGRTAAGLIRAVFFQLPKLQRAIKTENEWLREVVDQYQVDAVISDNRFGLYHSRVPSAFITHQLAIKTPFGPWIDRLIQKRNSSFINRFNECWVPDLEGTYGLAGELSHPALFPKAPVYYLGPLSRLKKNNISQLKKHLFISLSGPEPQRTLLENKIVDALGHYHGTATIVRGLPGEASLIPSTNDIRFFNHLPTDDFNKEMEKAEFMISRSGYSTIMDIAKLGKKAIVIPTPGQTEQEYLAEYLMTKKFAFSVKQHHFQLEKMLQQADAFDYKIPLNTEETKLSSVVSSFLEKVRKKNISMA
ncbi:glycosyltransferase [Terrimonas pollutisoli]|uniref:glycosyltransferase n=1 Tax=Terrimonas pollutisoli TaxID=3034147 RepID=UPI0023ED7CFC|nr:glycosyltransferase [Terrimonas sp. H1YJ31]